MNNFANALKKETNYTHTENGQLAYKSTLNACLDFFAKGSSMRMLNADSKYKMFIEAYEEDPLTALRTLFYIRDIREGTGERETFRQIIREFAIYHPDELRPNIKWIPYFGRWDDLYCLVDTPVEDEVIHIMKAESIHDVAIERGYPSLMWKWLASPNTSSKETNRLGRWTAHKVFNDTRENTYFKNYRKLLKEGRQRANVVEQKMSNKEWKDIDYKKLTSYNMLRYLKAFYRHDPKRFSDEFFKFIKADTLFPYDILNKVRINMETRENTPIADMYSKFWNALPDITNGNSVNTIVVADTSGSMLSTIANNSNTTSMDIALSLAIYFGEKLEGEFKNHFITFSEHPCYQKLVGDNLQQKLLNIDYTNWGMNTNIRKVFELILTTGKISNILDKDMPKRLLIISDMQFDSCANINSYREQPLIEELKERYREAGYTFPQLIFWDCGANSGTFHTTVDKNGFVLVSGASQRAFESIIRGETIVEEEVTRNIVEDGIIKSITETYKSVKIDPMSALMKTVHSERYQVINL